jgi:hypothetical protein
LAQAQAFYCDGVQAADVTFSIDTDAADVI